ncbi:MAG: threonine aldolase [Oscillospiraceae bacterium]|jgi:threonine aldolase|nr:threonine aldolase [Oscillospiraceae bacterium]
MKYSFKNDYSEIGHPDVLDALSSIGSKQYDGYGIDEHCSKAAELIKKKLNAPKAEVHFLPAGTIANLTFISSVLKPHEAVIAPLSGHIAVHETGAIEATGHKICTREGVLGKLTIADIESVLLEHKDEHMVKPRLVYISLPTECGTVYTKEELSDIYDFCRDFDLYLYIDGARLGAAINSPECDIAYNDIARLSDAFFIGGTKNGAIYGEAVVICNDSLKADFRYIMKQRGALHAKGFAIGAQFAELFAKNESKTEPQAACLYDSLAIHSITMAKMIAHGIHSLGYDFLYPVQTNIIIPVLPTTIVERLHKDYLFSEWERFDDMVAIRLVTSWATPMSAVEDFISDITRYK